MALFPLTSIGTSEKQTSLVDNGMMSHAWEGFHEKMDLLSTLVEKCVDFMGEFFYVLPLIATRATLEFPTYPPKCTLTFAWISCELKAQ